MSENRMEMLLNWRIELDKELELLRKRKADLNAKIALKESQAQNLQELLEGEGYHTIESSTVQVAANGSVADAAYDAVKEIGEPVYYKELAERLVNVGVVIPGKDPKANLLSHISRDQRFKRIKRGTYALAEWNLKTQRVRRPRKKRGTPQ